MGLSDVKSNPKAGRFWFLFLLLGIFAVIIGIYFMANFGAGFQFIAFLVSIYFMVAGVINLIGSIQHRGTPGWVASLILSLISIVIGILMITNYFTSWTLSVSEILVLIFCGIGLLSEAISLIVGSISFRKESGGTWIPTLILGIILLILAIIIIANPLYSIALINIFVSIAVMVFGVSTIVFSFQLLKAKKYMQ